MRTLCSSLMAALVVMALFFGNCLSCPQMLAQGAHRCCHRSQPGTAKCQSQGLQSFVKSGDAGGQARPATAGSIGPAAVPAARVFPAPEAMLALADPVFTPPSLVISLNSSLRI
jgi:hypothetical protein